MLTIILTLIPTLILILTLLLTLIRTLTTGRGLQRSALHAWSGDPDKIPDAQEAKA